MGTEDPCFGLDFIADWINVGRLTVVPSLAWADALSRSGCPFGNDGIFWVLVAETPPHQRLLQLGLADHLRMESSSVGL